MASVQVRAALAGTLPLSGSAAMNGAPMPILAQVSGTLPLGGQTAASLPLTAHVAGGLPLGGSAVVGIAPIVGLQAEGVLPLGGTASLALRYRATVGVRTGACGCRPPSISFGRR